ncbi:gene transfer agent family protein [Sphingopyxis sp.]|uniref:gene transfer agent family protein n=1 Tax=Sphingopyxis sp. TaxID=1908224 RepID=UPI002ED9D370
MSANALRGEAELRVGEQLFVLRPAFAALVAAEAELGPLFALVERAADGRLGLGELVALFWHCMKDRPGTLTREAVGEAVARQGLAAVTPALRVLLGQILQGR